MGKHMVVSVVARWSRIAVLVSITTVLTASMAFSQSLADFKQAASKKGVNAIPFSDLRKEASSIAGEVDYAKPKATKYKYDTMERQKTNVLKEIKSIKEEIEETKDEIDDMKSKYDDVDVSSLERDLDKLEDELEKKEDKIEDMNDDIEDAIEAWKRLAAARGGLREAFDDALDELKSARSSPKRYLGSDASDDDIDDFEDYVDDIISHIKSRIDDHKVQEDGADGRVKDFSSLLKKNSV